MMLNRRCTCTVVVSASACLRAMPVQTACVCARTACAFVRGLLAYARVRTRVCKRASMHVRVCMSGQACAGSRLRPVCLCARGFMIPCACVPVDLRARVSVCLCSLVWIQMCHPPCFSPCCTPRPRDVHTPYTYTYPPRTRTHTRARTRMVRRAPRTATLRVNAPCRVTPRVHCAGLQRSAHPHQLHLMAHIARCAYGVLRMLIAYCILHITHCVLRSAYCVLHIAYCM
jgi:hypothetical protein